MRIKICGITRMEDAQAASVTGADLLGFNFYPPSPRYVGEGSLTALLSAVQPPAVPVAVTVNPTVDQLEELILPGGRGGPRGFPVVQLHGDESADVSDWLIERGVKVIKAFHVAGADFAGPVRQWVEQVRQRAGLLAVLLDTPPRDPRQYGGTGRRFDWTWIAQARENGQLDGLPPVLLAGGLTPSNVATAVRLARPWGVDVAGGVESASGEAGVKSVDKIRDFIRNARVG